MDKSVFEVLSGIDVSEHVKSKGGFSFVPWADAWNYVKSHFPEARYENTTFEVSIDGSQLKLPYMIDHNGYAYVETTVYIQDDVQTETYPVLNYQNKPVMNPDSFTVNKSLKRALTKACSSHGLGLYVYRGEDLPDAGLESRLTDGKVPASGEITVDQTVILDRLSRNKTFSDAETQGIRKFMASIPSEARADKRINEIKTVINKRKDREKN